MNIGYSTRALAGEVVCGDMGGWWIQPQRTVFALADGIGHGVAAHHAASCAMECISRHLHRSCAELFMACNEALRKTRGAVLAIAVVDAVTNVMTLVSMGNIRTIVCSGLRQNRLSTERGIVGACLQAPQVQEIVLTPGDMVLMYSDGLDEWTKLSACFDDADPSPQRLAERILARWAIERDDASIFIYRHTVV
ncbi:SpoIIE family protein phosphatase [Herbaspirillum sp. RTI4]|uniref:SpoIIE family protein phosphatase n=1 Tax=Herbaspirillum sp. RTI4 TaxID=3048640 RepID=UPI002AB37FC8|nr:SpoIIE family protein phosphatase [Herbaspirillum sp. RTI4]MDY7579157.1 SpoIIE family protein phosphatase [Herbaspirillum sp. RTI4]MEA9981264.1 SpoIIE family protein phosphatase [Herbaspirillum sp. RTI4]